MKMTHKLCGAALVAVVGVAVAGPGVNKTQAAPDHTWTGDGKISFTAEDYNSNTDITNIPDTTSGTFTGSGTNGEFVIRAVTPLDFGTAEATIGSEITAWATPYDASGVDSANFVRFKDNRIQDTHTHEVSAQITSQFQTTGGKSLTGATIVYKNGRIVDAKDGSVMPSPANQTITDKEINATNRTAIYTNSEADKGRGDFFLVFGKIGDAALPIDQSVQLKIPNTVTDITNDTYRATVTWTMSETPL